MFFSETPNKIICCSPDAFIIIYAILLCVWCAPLAEFIPEYVNVDL